MAFLLNIWLFSNFKIWSLLSAVPTTSSYVPAAPTPSYEPVNPSYGPAVSSSFSFPSTSAPAPGPVISEIPDEYSQNPDHVADISGEPLFYHDVGKLRQKEKLVEGKRENYRPKVGPSLRILRKKKI